MTDCHGFVGEERVRELTLIGYDDDANVCLCNDHQKHHH